MFRMTSWRNSIDGVVDFIIRFIDSMESISPPPLRLSRHVPFGCELITPERRWSKAVPATLTTRNTPKYIRIKLAKNPNLSHSFKTLCLTHMKYLLMVGLSIISVIEQKP